MTSGPPIQWIGRDDKLHAYHQDGSRYLIAVEMQWPKGLPQWEFAVVQVNADGNMTLQFDCGCSYDTWQWDDVEWFALLDGVMPTAGPEAP